MRHFSWFSHSLRNPGSLAVASGILARCLLGFLFFFAFLFCFLPFGCVFFPLSPSLVSSLLQTVWWCCVWPCCFFFRLCPSAVLRCRWLRMSNWAICLEPKKMRCIKIRCCFVFEHSQGSSVDSLLGLLWVVWFRYIWMSVNFQLPRYLVLLLIASTESLSHCMLFLPRNL